MEAYLEKMNDSLPWGAWVSLVVSHYPDSKRGRKPVEIEQMILLLYSDIEQKQM